MPSTLPYSRTKNKGYTQLGFRRDYSFHNNSSTNNNGHKTCFRFLETLSTPNVSCDLSSVSQSTLPTSFLNVLQKATPPKTSKTPEKAPILNFQDLRTPVKVLSIDVTPRKLSQDEESLTTPPSETGYFEHNKTPAKSLKSGQGSPLAAIEEESLITPPSERYVTDDDTRTGATPRKTGAIGYEEQAICTPLKVLNIISSLDGS